MPNDLSYVISDADKLVAIGAQFYHQGNMDGARFHYLAALSLNPDHPQALQNLGAVLRQMRQYEAAASVSRRSIALTNGDPYCRGNYAVSLLGLRRYGDAKRVAKDVLKDIPEQGPQWHNYGLICYMTGAYKEALEAFDKSIALGHVNDDIRSDRSLTLLALGELAQGLESYECRWAQIRRFPPWEMDIAEWKGEPLAGKSILLHHEQGFGDTLMLSRFILPIVGLGAKVSLAVPSELKRLMAQSFSDATVYDWDDLATCGVKFDYHSPLLSAMRHYGVKKPDEIPGADWPYLVAKPHKPVKLPQARFRIGICWASGNHGPMLMERRRVASVTQFLPLTEIPNTAVVSLQLGDNQPDLVHNGLEGLIYDATFQIDDFADTAAIIHCLDLVISVDSAVVHLAAAMGKPTIMLSPYTRCWRWWSNRSGWPWYDRMRTFYQSQDGTWGTALEKAVSTARGDAKSYIG